jgi:hypothetical protein
MSLHIFIYHANRNQKLSGVATLISDEINIKPKTVKGNKKGHHIIIKYQFKINF